METFMSSEGAESVATFCGTSPAELTAGLGSDLFMCLKVAMAPGF